MHRGIGFLAAQHKTGQFRLSADGLGDVLIDAGARANRAARGQRCAGQQSAGLGTMDVALERFRVVETANECQTIPEIIQRREDFAQLHRRPFTLGPPLVFVKSAASEEDGHPRGRLAVRLAPRRVIAPHAQGFQPGQSHTDAQTTKKRSP